MIRIICVGKIKESFYREAILEYQKRIGKYHKLVVEEIMDSNPSEEGERILKKLNVKDFNVVLDLRGEMMDSVSFSNFIDETFLWHSTINFIIGGSDGLDDMVLEIADYRLSFSLLTFPHQLFRVVLLEQIYRAFKILHHESYHK